jgi:DNA-binding LacI/PurR family transcriptional regulator
LLKTVRRKTTIRDVARRADVTPAVVSRVFNDDATLSIKPETREVVQKAIDELDYRPNSVARSLRLHLNNAIGVVISDILNPFFTEITKGIQQAAAAAGYSILLCGTEDDAGEVKRHIDVLNSHMVGGMILGAGHISAAEIELLEGANMKYVMLNRITSSSNAPYVRCDDYSSFVKVTKHVIGLGHTKIGHLSGPLYADTAVRRLQGYRMALVDAGILGNSDYIIETNFDEQTGYDACRKMLDLLDPPTAICASNDMVAIGAMRAIKERGLHIPGDISLTGYNDIWIASRLDPPLTTVRYPLTEMGETAFRLLMKLMSGEKPDATHIELETELVVRGSTGTVRSESTD